MLFGLIKNKPEKDPLSLKLLTENNLKDIKYQLESFGYELVQSPQYRWCRLIKNPSTFEKHFCYGDEMLIYSARKLGCTFALEKEGEQ